MLSTDEVTLALRALATNSYSKILAEPNLVTLNGQSASFLAGGEFAVPTVVGVEGVAAVSTQFRGFGTQLTFTPTIIDKDRIRLMVAPSFSTLNQDLSVQGIPGLNSRAVLTTVDLREGQWLAIAGLLQDQQSGSKIRVPLIGDIPVVSALFSNRKVSRRNGTGRSCQPRTGPSDGRAGGAADSSRNGNHRTDRLGLLSGRRLRRPSQLRPSQHGVAYPPKPCLRGQVRGRA